MMHNRIGEERHKFSPMSVIMVVATLVVDLTMHILLNLSKLAMEYTKLKPQHCSGGVK